MNSRIAIQLGLLYRGWVKRNMSVIQKYNKKEIAAFVSQHYKIPVKYISETKKGLDNSVYIITAQDNQRYILKIVETKKESQIKASIKASTRLKKEFSRIRYLKCDTGKLVIPFNNGKPAFLYRYRKGRPLSICNSHDLKRVARFLKDFHAQSKKTPIKSADIFNKFKKELDLYNSKNVMTGINKDFKKEFKELSKILNQVYNSLPNLQKKIATLSMYSGLVHSDFTPDNIISNQGCMELIDFDALKENGPQIIDLLQFASKSGIAGNKKKLSTFFNTYSNSPYSHRELDAFKALLLLFSLKSLLSTLYYTYDISKIDAGWVKRNAMYTLKPLYKSAKSLREELIP